MSHLSAEEFVDLLDDTLPPARRVHLESCAACRGEAGVLGVVLARSAAAADVPEPSPLFWDHLSARVREGIGAPPARSWRDWVWWRGAAWTAGLASLALAAAMTFESAPRAPLTGSPRPAAAATAPRAAVAAAAEADDLESDEAWALVRSVADQVEEDAAHDAGISARPGAAERMAHELSALEQSELARLLRGELGQRGT